MFHSAPITTLNYEKAITSHMRTRTNEGEKYCHALLFCGCYRQSFINENCTSSLSQKHNTTSSLSEPPKTLVLIRIVFFGSVILGICSWNMSDKALVCVCLATIPTSQHHLIILSWSLRISLDCGKWKTVYSARELFMSVETQRTNNFFLLLLL